MYIFAFHVFPAFFFGNFFFIIQMVYSQIMVREDLRHALT